MRIRINPFGRRNIERTRKIIDHRVDQILNTLVLKCRTAGDRDKFICDGQPTDSRFQFFWCYRLFFEEESSDFVVEVGYLFDEVIIGPVDHFLMVIRDGSHLVDRSE